MMLLISLGLLVAFGASIATEFGWIDVDLWFELSTLVTVMLLGHWLEMRAIGQAQGALAALAELLPDQAERVRPNGVETIPLDALDVGDIVLVRAGGRVPADGVVVEGDADLDEAMITGESRPVAEAQWRPRRGGNRVDRLRDSGAGHRRRRRHHARGHPTSCRGSAGITIPRASAGGSVCRALVLCRARRGRDDVRGLGAIGEIDQAVERTVTVLVIACPHALGLAIPLTIAVSTSLAARAGILVKDRLALERMRTIDVVLFDKTGTLTTGRPAVTGLVAAGVADK